MLNRSSSFFCFLNPGNDVMSAILSLLIETLVYGFVIIFLVTFLIWVTIFLFSIDNPAQTENYERYGLNEYQSSMSFYRSSVWYLFFFDMFRLQWEYNDVRKIVTFPFYFSKREESLLDICFLVFPTIVVILILIPTLGFLYNNEYNVEHVSTAMSIDVVGHQWYWSYEYHIGNSLEVIDFSFDSILDVDAVENLYLEVDRRVVIPTDVCVSLTITSTDVIHSWAVPQLGIKVDAIPGRLANAVLYTFIDGVFYGQCSELCGVLHGFMPICVESVPLNLFFCWASLNTDVLSNVCEYICIND